MTERSFVDRELADNLQRVEDTIQTACAEAGRDRSSVTLLAVTKTVEPERINQAIAWGIRQIGENRVQEYKAKQPFLHLEGVACHLIGHLQTNKVRQIIGQVDMIQSVDSIHLAQEISRRSAEAGIVTPILVEVNIGGEEAKSGVAPEALEELLAAAAPLPGLHVRGLMTVPPILPTEKEKRAVFSKMYQLFVDIRDKNIDNIDMLELSMGMSGDYREAILEGATIVRVGSAIFGRRQY